jgi:hypothetical protein
VEADQLRKKPHSKNVFSSAVASHPLSIIIFPGLRVSESPVFGMGETERRPPRKE